MIHYKTQCVEAPVQPEPQLHLLMTINAFVLLRVTLFLKHKNWHSLVKADKWNTGGCYTFWVNGHLWPRIWWVVHSKRVHSVVFIIVNIVDGNLTLQLPLHQHKEAALLLRICSLYFSKVGGSEYMTSIFIQYFRCQWGQQKKMLKDREDWSQKLLFTKDITYRIRDIEVFFNNRQPKV